MKDTSHPDYATAISKYNDFIAKKGNIIEHMQNYDLVKDLSSGGFKFGDELFSKDGYRDGYTYIDSKEDYIKAMNKVLENIQDENHDDHKYYDTALEQYESFKSANNELADQCTFEPKSGPQPNI